MSQTALSSALGKHSRRSMLTVFAESLAFDEELTSNTHSRECFLLRSPSLAVPRALPQPKCSEREVELAPALLPKAFAPRTRALSGQVFVYVFTAFV